MRTQLLIKHSKETALLGLLILPVSYLFFMPVEPGYLVLFLILGISYYKSLADDKFRIVYIIVQLGTVAIIGAFYTPWSLCLGFYPAIVTGLLDSYRIITRIMLSMTIFYAGAISLYYMLSLDEFQPYWIPVVLSLYVIPYVIRALYRSWETSMKLNRANKEIERLVKNAERQRIARDLHDTLGQTLSMITVKSELVERLIPTDKEQAMAEVREVQTISRSILLQVRELVSDMQSINIEDELKHAVSILHTAGIRFIHEKNPSTSIDSTIEHILGMCLRECITNVVNHSNAETCTISLQEFQEEYVLVVKDDGKGMNKENTRFDEFGNGVLGMRDRLLLIEGKINYESSLSQGTKVTITVPKK
ncbi:sensor histidine kinase [Ornithinibacillus salinisoli]|uniref:histidine kinase n=1 Tax=Ornithinibacillus salinisoli TaxID=1848459 RepID=A0ABW4W1X7_9BACI